MPDAAPKPSYVPWIFVAPSGRQWVHAQIDNWHPGAVRVTIWRREGRYRRQAYPTLAAAVAATEALAARTADAGWRRVTELDTGTGWVLVRPPPMDNA